MEKIGKLVDIGFITFLICTKYVISFTTFSVDGLIEIADKVTGILKGTFELHFENLDEIEGFPSKVSILDGRFEVNERN